MKNYILLIAILSNCLAVAQYSKSGLRMTTDYSASDSDLRDILMFESIDYMKIGFSGKELKDKSYHITVKEIWNGEIVNDTTVFNSRDIGIEQYEKVNDSVLNFRVVSKLTHENKLKMSFFFPRFGITREFDAIDYNEYSLRNIAAESDLEIGYDEKFYLLAYILPYEKEDGSKSWCEVGTSGDKLEKWGEEYGIEHYLVFEMEFK